MASESGTYGPEVIARRLKIAEAMLNEQQPVQHWAQGLNELAKGYVGGRIFNKAEESEREGMKAQYQALAAILGGGAGAPPTPEAAPSPGPITSGPRPATAPPLTAAPPPDDMPIVPKPVQTQPIRQATAGLDIPEATSTAPNSRVSGAFSMLPPPQATLPAAPPTPPAPRVPAAPIAAAGGAPTPPAAAGNADAKAKIAAMLNDPNPYVRRQGAALATSLLPSLIKKDEWSPMAGPGGVLMQRNLGSGELKAHPAAQDYNIQKNDDGSIVAVNKHDPSDFKVLQPPGVRENLVTHAGEKKAAETAGEARGKVQFDLPAALEKSEFMLDTIKNVEEHPGLAGGTGATGIPRRKIYGTKEYNFDVAAQQLKGKAFLEAYTSLKGAGAITEGEGKAATAAIARLDEAQSEEAYRSALKDLRTVVQSGVNRLRLQSGKSKEEIENIRKQVGPSAGNTGVRKYNPETGKIE